MKWLGKGRFRSLQGQGGFTLIETLVAVAILAAIGVIFLSALTTVSKNTDLYQQRATAENLALSQVEYIKAGAYRADGIYPVNVTLPPEYNITISTITVPGTIGDKQEITVAVRKAGRPLFKLTIIKNE